jgi:hypothetical protein
MIQVVLVKRIVLLVFICIAALRAGSQEMIPMSHILTGKVARWVGPYTVEITTKREKEVWVTDRVTRWYTPAVVDELTRIGGSTGIAPLPATPVEHTRDIGHYEQRMVDETVTIKGVATGTVKPGQQIKWRIQWDGSLQNGRLLPGKVTD